MKKNGIVAYREKLEQVIDNYHDFLSDEAESLCREHSIPSAKRLQADLASIADKNRLLKIGIVGRVKSGKSSLLNALLFGGRSILPKAATPMTAALTTLSHGETPSAEVEFFSQKDFEDIKAKHGEYDIQLERRRREILKQEKRGMTRSQRTSQRSPEERAQGKAKREMDEKPELSAAHEQCVKMKDTGLSIRMLGESKLLGFEKLSDLNSRLDDYVGVNGKYMPFTKSVNIRLPQENLKDIEIVDTPGINDPVQSREERTREHLNQCDVVLILSPAGQFMNETDQELMDRITKKEGIQELYVVAAKADDPLFSDLKDKNNGHLDRVLDSLTGELGIHLREVIANLKERNPEVKDTYDQLLQGQSQIIHSSGICESLKQLFEQKDKWDELMQHVWNNLLADYPDYFSDMDEDLSRISLDKLSNISAIENIIEKIRDKKRDIIDRRITDYIESKEENLGLCINGLLEYVNDRHSEIASTDIRKIKNQREKLIKALDNASEEIKWEYDESVYRIEESLKKEFKRELVAREQALEQDIDQENRVTTEMYETGIIFKKTVAKNQTTIRTNAVVRYLSEFSEELAEEVADKTEAKKREWRNDLDQKMTKILRDDFGDENLKASMIKRVIKNTVSAINIPAFEYKKPIPDSLKPQGVLKEKKAEKYFNEARDYVSDLCREIKKEIRTYRISLTKKMEQVRLDELLLKQFTKELDTLEKSITKKEMELKRISNLKGELEKIGEVS